MDENAFIDYLGAREAALLGAAGYFSVANVSTESLRIIAETTTDETIRLAARVVLYQRGDL